MLQKFAWNGVPVSRKATCLSALNDVKPCGISLREKCIKPAVLLACGNNFRYVCITEYYEFTDLVNTTGEDRWGPLARFTCACPDCFLETPDITDAAIERAVVFILRAKSFKCNSEEEFKLSNFAIDELEKVEKHVGGAMVNPGQAACHGFLSLEVWGKPKRAIGSFEPVIRDQKRRLEKNGSIVAFVDNAFAALSDDRADRIAKDTEQEIISIGSVLTTAALLNIHSKLGEAKEAISDWNGAKKPTGQRWLMVASLSASIRNTLPRLPELARPYPRILSTTHCHPSGRLARHTPPHHRHHRLLRFHPHPHVHPTPPGKTGIDSGFPHASQKQRPLRDQIQLSFRSLISSLLPPPTDPPMYPFAPGRTV